MDHMVFNRLAGQRLYFLCEKLLNHIILSRSYCPRCDYSVHLSYLHFFCSYIGWIPGFLGFLNSVNDSWSWRAQIICRASKSTFCVGFWVGEHPRANFSSWYRGMKLECLALLKGKCWLSCRWWVYNRSIHIVISNK